MVDYNIRQIKSEDSEIVSTIVRRCLKEVNSKVYPETVINYIYELYTPPLIRSIIGTKYIIVYELNNQILGTANINLDEKYIGTVFVNPDFHHQGIGSSLMNAIELYGKEHKLKKVYVHASLNAENFYKNRGYKKIRKVHNPNFGETIRMRKKLKVK